MRLCVLQNGSTMNACPNLLTNSHRPCDDNYVNLDFNTILDDEYEKVKKEKRYRRSGCEL